MIYKSFKDKKLSALGMGTMRLPLAGKDESQIDESQTARMFDYAIEQGINYFDTAWGYHSGQSEIVTGKTLARYPRDSFYLATKFPGYDLDNMDKVEEIFHKQLEKCQVDYFDFYLIHNVCETNIEGYLDEKYGIVEYLLKQKEEGKIHHLGFSAHGSYDVMKRFLEAWGTQMEFCQIQLNYLDWKLQDARAKVELLNEYHLPIWVMEPVRGGMLASLAPEHEAKLKALRPEEGIPAWAFRYLQSMPEVTMVLSGMSNYEQMKDNIATYAEEKPLNQQETEAVMEVADAMIAQDTLPCTACRYCTDYCPNELDIPTLLGHYNEHKISNGGFLAPMAIAAMPEDKRPGACVGCASCEAVCPQQIKISEAMADLAKMIGM